MGNALPSGHEEPLLLEKEYKQVTSDFGGGTKTWAQDTTWIAKREVYHWEMGMKFTQQ